MPSSGVIHHAYLRWLLTQGERPWTSGVEVGTDGWLFGRAALHARRAPGNTCLSALRNAQAIGSPPVARNDSKGCGGVMRVAPIGLLGGEDPDAVFGLAADAAALTHGHPAGFLSAGHFAATVYLLRRGLPLGEAVDHATGLLRRRERSAETVEAVAAGRGLAACGRPSPERIETLGGGWVAEEALAIALCCALSATGFKDGVLLAANHSGDSDSTAAMTGNLLGTLLGEYAIPPELRNGLELGQEIALLADDLHGAMTGALDPEAIWDRYPGW